MELGRGGHTLVGYPALADAGDGVAVQVFDTPERAAEVHRAGVRRLLTIAFRDRIREIEKSVARDNALNLRFAQLARDVELAGEVRWGEWRIRSELEGLRVRGWRPGDRLAGRRRKIQDVFVDAKIPRSEREAWPLVVRGDEVVAVPGIVTASGIEADRVEP